MAAQCEPIKMGVAEYFTGQHLPQMLSHFAQILPNISLDVTVELTDQLLAHLDDSDLDIVIASHRSHRSHRAHRSDAHIVHEDASDWVAGPGYVMPTSGPVDLVAMSESCHYRRMATEAMDSAGLEWRLRYTTSSIVNSP